MDYEALDEIHDEINYLKYKIEELSFQDELNQIGVHDFILKAAENFREANKLVEKKLKELEEE